MAARTDQGQAHRPDQRRPSGPIPWRRLQLLAVHPGQRRGSRLRREGRELAQAVRPRPEGAGGHCRQDSGGHGQDRRHHRPRRASFPGPADRAHRHRSRPRRGLRPDAGRHQRGGAGGDRRRGRGRALSALQRPQLPDRGAPAARTARRPRRHRPDHRAGAIPQGRSDRRPFERGGENPAGLGRLVRLPRAAGTLHPDQVLGARPRPRRRGERGPGSRGPGGEAADGLSHRMGG